MPINLSEQDGKQIARLEGVVTIEETDQLFEILRQEPAPSLDLSGCEHLHTAALQLILALKPEISAPPPGSFWNRCLGNGGE